MGLGAVDFWVGETNKGIEFGLGPRAAVGRSMLSKRGLLVFHCLIQFNSGNQTELSRLVASPFLVRVVSKFKSKRPKVSRLTALFFSCFLFEFELERTQKYLFQLPSNNGIGCC